MLLIVLLIIFITLNILDILTTNKVLSQGGIELNKFMVLSMKYFGKYWWVPKMILVLLIIVAVWLIQNLIGLIVIAAINIGYVWVVFHNWQEIKRG